MIDLTSEHVRWCFDNDWVVNIVPTSITKNPRVKLEVHNKVNNTLKPGKYTYGQVTKRDKEELYNKIDELYKAIYNKFN
jgi:hypothetical protein